jgi:hypothetical protein
VHDDLGRTIRLGKEADPFRHCVDGRIRSTRRDHLTDHRQAPLSVMRQRQSVEITWRMGVGEQHVDLRGFRCHYDQGLVGAFRLQYRVTGIGTRAGSLHPDHRLVFDDDYGNTICPHVLSIQTEIVSFVVILD